MDREFLEMRDNEVVNEENLRMHLNLDSLGQKKQ